MRIVLSLVTMPGDAFDAEDPAAEPADGRGWRRCPERSILAGGSRRG
jgi:hypothetical protein